MSGVNMAEAPHCLPFAEVLTSKSHTMKERRWGRRSAREFFGSLVWFCHVSSPSRRDQIWSKKWQRLKENKSCRLGNDLIKQLLYLLPCSIYSWNMNIPDPGNIKLSNPKIFKVVGSGLLNKSFLCSWGWIFLFICFFILMRIVSSFSFLYEMTFMGFTCYLGMVEKQEKDLFV